MLDKNTHTARMHEGDVNFSAEDALILASGNGRLDQPLVFTWLFATGRVRPATFLKLQLFNKAKLAS